MSRFELDRVLDRLSKLVPPMMQWGGAEKPVPPVDEDGAARPTAEPDGLLERLRAVPEPEDAWNGPGFVLCRERDEGRGEDAYLAVASEERRFVGVFDGCGGSGAKVYDAFDGHTGAWVASRAAVLATRQWFLNDPEGDLSAHIDRALERCKAGEEGQLLMGSLSREFPTTMAAFCLSEGGDRVDLRWCGDSRCYVLDGGGLHQVTTDDAAITDAMRNLREDAPMTNVICASRPYVIHRRGLRMKAPAVLLAATDGCFGYLPSPMAFESLLLETMSRASSFEGWKRGVNERLRDISGDDYTMAVLPIGFHTYKGMKRAFGKRLSLLRQRYPQAEASEGVLAEQWKAYRTGYEALLPREATAGREAKNHDDQ